MKKFLCYSIFLLTIFATPSFSQSYYLELSEKMVSDNQGYQSPRILSSDCEMIFDAENLKVWYFETFNGNSEQLYWNVESIEKDYEFENVFYWKVDRNYHPLKYIELNLNGNKVSIGNDIYTIRKNKTITGDWIRNKLNEIELRKEQSKQTEKEFEENRKQSEEIQKKKEIELNSKLPWNGSNFGFNENDTAYYVIYFKIGNTDSVDIDNDFNLSFYMSRLISDGYQGIYSRNNWVYYRKFPPVPKLDEKKCYMFLKDCDAALDAIKYIEENLEVINICSNCINGKEKIIDFWNRIGIYFYTKKGNHLRDVEWDEATHTIIPKSYMPLTELLFGNENRKKEMERYIENFFIEKKRNEEN